MLKNIIFSPIASLVFLVLGSAFFMTFITVRLNSNDVSEIIVGFIHSSFYSGILLAAVKSEQLITRIGHIRAFSSSASLITLMVILQALFPNPLLWVIFRFITGFALAGAYIIIESWLLAQSTKNTKGKILSIYMISIYLSQSLGQFLLDIVDINSYAPFFLAAMLSSIAVIPASLTYVKEPNLEINDKLSIAKCFYTAPFGFLGCIIAGLVLSVIYSFLANYAQDYNLHVSNIIGITIAGGFCLQLPIGKISDLFDRSKVLTCLAFLAIILSILIPIFVNNLYILYIMCFLFGGFCFSIYPVSIAQVCDYFDNKNMLSVISALLFAYGVGSIFGPLIVSFFIDAFSSIFIFIYIALANLTLLIIGVYTIIKVKPAAEEKQVDFVAIPTRTTPVTGDFINSEQNSENKH